VNIFILLLSGPMRRSPQHYKSANVRTLYCPWCHRSRCLHVVLTPSSPVTANRTDRSFNSRRHNSRPKLKCLITTTSSFQWRFSRTFFSRRSLVSKQRHCHIRQTICSTRFGVRMCLLVVWCKNFQPPLYRPPKFKIFHCKMGFFVKITLLL